MQHRTVLYEYGEELLGLTMALCVYFCLLRTIFVLTLVCVCMCSVSLLLLVKLSVLAK